jgi:hypothetical protein
MTRSISYLVVCTFLLSALAVPSRAAADPITIDQQNLGPRQGGYGVTGDATLAQTFTVGITGLLTQVDLGIFNPNDTSRGDLYFPDPLTIELRGTSAAAPNTDVLYSWSVPVADVTLERTALTSFSLTGLDVVAGQTLAIVLSTGSDGNYGWSYACCYDGGEAFVPSPNTVPGDFIFRTYVDPAQPAPTPEPATWVLLGLGLATVSMVSRRSSRPSRGCSTRSMGLP